MRQSTVIKGIIIVVLAGIITFVIHSLASSIAHLFSKENMIKLLEFVGVSLLIIIVLWLIWLLLVWLYKKTFPTPHTTTTATPPPPPATPAATVTTTVAAAPAAGATPAGGATATTTVVTPPAPHPPHPAAGAHPAGDHPHGPHKNWETRIMEFASGLGLVLATALFICGMFYWQCCPETFYYRTGARSKFVIEKNHTPINVVVTVLTKMTTPDGREVLIYPNGGGAKLIRRNSNLSPYIDQTSFENMGKGTYTLEVYAGQGEVASKTRVAIGKMSKLILKAFYYD